MGYYAASVVFTTSSRLLVLPAIETAFLGCAIRKLFALLTATTDESLNLLKPTGHVMNQQFNIQQLYVLPTLYLCVLYLRTNSDLCHLQHKLISFYNGD